MAMAMSYNLLFLGDKQNSINKVFLVLITGISALILVI